MICTSVVKCDKYIGENRQIRRSGSYSYWGSRVMLLLLWILWFYAMSLSFPCSFIVADKFYTSAALSHLTNGNMSTKEASSYSSTCCDRINLRMKT